MASYALFSRSAGGVGPELPDPVAVVAAVDAGPAQMGGVDAGGDRPARLEEPVAASLFPLSNEPDRSQIEHVEEFQGPPAPEPLAPKREGSLRVTTGHIQEGSTLAEQLESNGIDRATVDLVARGLRPVFDFRYARKGDFFALIQDEHGELLSFEYQRGRSDLLRLSVDPEGQLEVKQRELPLERRVVQLGGVVEKSLFDSIRELGERPALVHDFADIFVWDFDFATQTRPGDEFRMVFEKFYDANGFVRYGSILAAQYRGSSEDYTAIYFENGEGEADYYTPDGNSVRRTFLRAPVKYSRISSRYSKSRLHPILNVRRPHEGIDYAAPTGTPIWAVAEGEVIFKGWSGGFGRLIKIRHNNGYVSYYGHLSRYAGNLKVGSRVEQQQVVGYVGSTGLATGPHLDYRLKVDGRFVDPLKVRFPHGNPVPNEELDRFAALRDELLAELSNVSPPLVLEAGM